MSGITYAFNGTALDRNAGTDIRESGIWKDDPSVQGLKISIDPIIQRGLGVVLTTTPSGAVVIAQYSTSAR